MFQLSQFQSAAHREGGLNRRLFVAYCTALGSMPWVGRWASAAEARPQFSANPFSLGIASGDPDSSSVVLWTRLAPEPLTPGGGMEWPTSSSRLGLSPKTKA